MLNDIVILTNITESDRCAEVKEIVEQGSRYTIGGTLVYNEGIGTPRGRYSDSL
ncbi:MAG: hypothetical protein ACLTE2_06160 [Eubacteriales bacterium]